MKSRSKWPQSCPIPWLCGTWVWRWRGNGQLSWRTNCILRSKWRSSEMLSWYLFGRRTNDHKKTMEDRNLRPLKHPPQQGKWCTSWVYVSEGFFWIGSEISRKSSNSADMMLTWGLSLSWWREVRNLLQRKFESTKRPISPISCHEIQIFLLQCMVMQIQIGF